LNSIDKMPPIPVTKLVYTMNATVNIYQIADTKLADAQLLFNNACYENALYLGGYCIELYLKAKICLLLDEPNFFSEGYTDKEVARSFKIHRLEHLLILAGLNAKMRVEKGSNSTIFKNWSLMSIWSEKLRYETISTQTQQDVKFFLDAITDPKTGIKQWILNN
jgi:hypothetical protein